MATYILLKECEDNQFDVHGLSSADTKSLIRKLKIERNASDVNGYWRAGEGDEILSFHSDITIPKILNETSKLGYQVCASMSHHDEKIWTLVKHTREF